MRFPDLPRFIRAAIFAARFYFINHKIRVSRKEKARRLEVCKACPYSTTWAFRNESFRQCLVCTCLVEAKAELITEECPKGLWKL